MIIAEFIGYLVESAWHWARESKENAETAVMIGLFIVWGLLCLGNLA